MDPITYVLQFEGEGTPDETEGGIRVSCRAHGCTISTGVGSGGEIRSRFQKAGSEIADFHSLVVPCGDGLFDETGSISFHDGESVLTFETVGKGHMSEAPGKGVQRGAVIWRIVSGSGALSGATGYITSNFTLTEGRHVLDHQMGLIYLSD